MKIAYLRVSTDDQEQDLQRPQLEQFAPPGTVFLEEKGSAWKRDDLKLRPVFAGIVADIQKGKVKDLYVWDVDRIYRKRARLKEFFELCKAHGCTIHSYRQQFLNVFDNLQLPDGFNFLKDMYRESFIQFLGWTAEEESKKKSDRSKLAVRVKDGVTMSYKGKRWGRPEIPAEAIAEIRTLWAGGASYREISRRVTYRTAEGKLKHPSLGKISELVRSEKDREVLYK